MNNVDVTVLKYENYKGRSDVVLNSWFRLSNRFLEDSDFFDFTAEEKLTWIYILSLASQKNSGTISLNFKHADKICGLKAEIVKSALEKLSKIPCIAYDDTLTLRGRNADVLVSSEARALHNKQNKTDRTEQDRHLSPEPQAVAVVAKKPTLTISLISKEVPISVDLAKSWADTYPKEYLEIEIKKARSWLIVNPHKHPKSNFGRFFNSWLDRGWEKYRQTLKSNPTQITVEDLEAILKKDAE